MRWIQTGSMEYIILFNKIFNGRGAIGRKAQTVATMLARDHFDLNAIFEDYGIKDMTPENDFEMKRYQAARKVEDPQFIIPPGYILPETTTTSVLLNDANIRPPLSGQPRSRTASKSGRNTSRKRRTIESDDDMIDEPVNKKKVKKLTGGEQIAVEISKWSSQNAASLEARRVEIMKPEAKVLADMKI